MSNARNNVEKQYGTCSPLARIYNALSASGKDLNSLTIDDLSPVDLFHMRGRQATSDLANLAQLRPGLRLLDVGSGLGGSARFLASHYGCTATGIDLTHGYVEAAAGLTAAVGLGERVSFVHGSATDLPFADGSFDVVWTEHVQMNIPDKQLLYREIARVVAPGGLLAFHDVCRGPAGDPLYPVPWSDTPHGSFLFTSESFQGMLRTSGFSISAWQDVSGECLEWFSQVRQENRKHGPSPLGLQLLMGESARQKSENLIRNLQEKRLVAVQGVVRKSADNDGGSDSDAGRRRG